MRTKALTSSVKKAALKNRWQHGKVAETQNREPPSRTPDPTIEYGVGTISITPTIEYGIGATLTPTTLTLTVTPL
jgi:hypothetical protein